MATQHDRPGLDQKPLPYPHREATYCPVCGESGTFVKFAPNGLDVVQVHCVHDWKGPCQTCGGNHPQKVCVVWTWPPTRWMKTRMRIHDPNGPLPPTPE